MKKRIACSVLSALLLGLTLSACGESSGVTGEIHESGYPKMELIVSAIDSHDKTSAHEIEIFTELVTERSGGAITFKVFYDNLLGKATDNLNTLSSGIADLGTVCTLYTPSNLPLSQITYCIPFAPSDPTLAAELMYKVSEEYPEFYEEYEKNNVVCLGWKGNEPYKQYSKAPIGTVSDVRHEADSGRRVLYPLVPVHQCRAGECACRRPVSDHQDRRSLRLLRVRQYLL